MENPLHIILGSNDEIIRRRALSMFNSMLMIDPLKVLSSFQLFLPSLVKNKSDSILEVSVIISKSIIDNCSKISKDSMPSLVLFLSLKICDFNKSERKNPLWSDESKKILSSAVLSLFKAPNSRFSILDRVTVLYRTNDPSFIEDLEQNMDKIPKESVDDNTIIHILLKTFESTEIEISKFSAKALYNIVKFNPKVTEIIYKESPFISTRFVDVQLAAYKELQVKLSQNPVNKSFNFQPIMEPSQTLSSVSQDSDLFSRIDPSNLGKFLRKTNTEVVFKPRKSRGLSIVFHSSLLTEINPQSQSKLGTLDFNAPLGEYLEKIGGLNVWQNRWFDFFPRSACMVWRDKPTEPKIKGILFVDKNCVVRMLPNKKDRQFVIEIQPNEAKCYYLAFKTDNSRQTWYNALQNCINRLK